MSDQVTRTTRAPRWMTALLVVSLSANLAVAGVLGGLALRGEQAEETADAGLDRRQARVLRLLPESRREEGRAMLLATAEAMAQARTAMETVQNEVVAALRAEPFDAARLETALAARRQALAEIHALTHAQIVALATQMSEGERVAMAERMADGNRLWAENRQR